MKHTNHNMTVKQPYFEYLRSGYKTIELRLYDEKRRKIQPGDTITFTNGDLSFQVEVKGLFICENFERLFEFVNPKDTGLETTENAIHVMEQFYDKEAQEKFGVVGIVVETI